MSKSTLPECSEASVLRPSISGLGKIIPPVGLLIIRTVQLDAILRAPLLGRSLIVRANRIICRVFVADSQAAASFCSAIPVSLFDQPADFGINDIERAGGVDLDEVLRPVSKLKESLTAALQLFQRLFALAGEEHICRRIQIDREMWLGIAFLQKPPV